VFINNIKSAEQVFIPINSGITLEQFKIDLLHKFFSPKFRRILTQHRHKAKARTYISEGNGIAADNGQAEIIKTA
jgi:hypothetical protein